MRLISIDLVFISTLSIDVLLLIYQLHVLSTAKITKESSLSIEIKSTHHIRGHLFIDLRKSTETYFWCSRWVWFILLLFCHSSTIGDLSLFKEEFWVYLLLRTGAMTIPSALKRRLQLKKDETLVGDRNRHDEVKPNETYDYCQSHRLNSIRLLILV